MRYVTESENLLQEVPLPLTNSIHLLEGCFDFAYLSVEFTDEADGMLKLKGFGGRRGANGAIGGAANFDGFRAIIVTLGGC